LGISLSPHDLHETGLLGEEFTGITTTIGALEAKRTTAWPDMAALCVRMLHEAGVQPGDKVGAGFSGSFPGMNLAMVAACEAMGAELICISSVGASTYGANHDELTNPEMLLLCYQQGLLSTPPAAVTLGGQDDVGENMLGVVFEETEVLEAVFRRLEDKGLSLTRIADYPENIAWRMSVYGQVDCFVNAGGNIAATGKDQAGYNLGQGLLSAKLSPVDLTEKSGLITNYLALDVPAIQLLNVKELCAEYGLAFDPVSWPERGESAVFYSKQYNRPGVALTAVLAVLPLLGCYGVKRWIKRSHCKSEIKSS
jgi:poly-gamma-glutamate system protein